MGVNLSELVRPTEIEFENLYGKRIAIDAYNSLYQFLSTIRDRFTGEPLRDSQGRITSHISGLFYRTARMLEANIKPVYIFDGEPPEFKKETVELRSEIRKEAEIKWKEALERGEIEKVKMYAQGAARLTEDMIEDAKRILSLMGVPWIDAPSEGEAQAAYMVKSGKVWASGSQDWDSLLFGANRLVRNLTITGRRKIPRKESYVTIRPEIVELEAVLSSLGITREQLICIGILVGTDYNPGGIRGIGPKNALKIVKEKKTFHEIFKDIRWEHSVSPEEIYNFFRNPPVKDVEISKIKPDYEKLQEVLVEEYNFSKERIEHTVKKLQEAEDKAKQSSLGRFFF